MVASSPVPEPKVESALVDLDILMMINQEAEPTVRSFKFSPKLSTNPLIYAILKAYRQELQLEQSKRELGGKKPEVKPKEEKGEKKKKGLDVSEKYKSMDEHKIELSELYARLGVDPAHGLTNEIATAKNLELGDNMLSGKKKTPWYIMLLKELTTFFAILLWIGGILSIIAYLLSPTDPSNVNILRIFNPD